MPAPTPEFWRRIPGKAESAAMTQNRLSLRPAPLSRALTLGAVLLLLAGAVRAADPGARVDDVIGEIRFVNNKTTRPQIMLQEMLVHVGDAVDTQRIERSRQAIMDLGLFKSVRAELLPGPRGRVLEITVDERYYILPLPKFSRSGDGDVSYGAEVTWHNVAGLNQTIEVGYKNKDYASDSDVESEKNLSLDYTYPRVNGTFYNLSVNAKDVSQVRDLSGDAGAAGRYEQNARNLGVSVSRWLRTEGPSTGWRLAGGLRWEDRDYQLVSGTPGLREDGRVIAASGNVEYTDVHDFLYSRGGRNYGYEVELGVPALGSDQSFSVQRLYYQTYLPVFDWPHSNLNLRFQLGSGNARVFGEDIWDIGGSTLLRGYDRDTIKGNAFVLANAELLVPLFGHAPLRGVVFADVGNAYPSFGKIDLGDLKASAGLGLRWKLKSFVNVTLRVEAAYAFDTGETKIYAGTKETF